MKLMDAQVRFYLRFFILQSSWIGHKFIFIYVFLQVQFPILAYLTFRMLF